MTIEDLPHSVTCPECPEKHFLTVNRSLDGSWSLGYVEFENHTACVYINDASNLNEGALRMKYALERYDRRRPPQTLVE